VYVCLYKFGAPSCLEIVLKSAIILKFYSFGQNVLIWTFVMLFTAFFYTFYRAMLAQSAVMRQ